MISTGTMTTGIAGMAHAGHTMAAGVTMTGADAHAGHHKADPKLPAAHDPRFMDLTVGRAEDAKQLGKYTQAGGAGYGGLEGEDVNNQEDKNEIIDKTDANHLPQYGVLPGQNYVEAIQSYTGLSAIKDLAGMQGFPLSDADWTAIVALQDRGGSPVLATVNYLTGLTNDRPADLPAQIAAKRDAVSGYQLPGAGGETIRDIAINPKDRSGNNIARSHHSADWFGKYRGMVEAGYPEDWAFQLSFSDDATSGSGRFNGFNNQDGNKTGANDGEDAYFKMVAIMSQQLGRPDLFFNLVASGHDHTALDPSVKTEPKINKLIGWNPPTDDTMSRERVEAIRQYYLRPDATVDQDDFNRHLKTIPASLAGQVDFSGVQFKPEEQNTGGGGGGNDGGNDTPAGPPTGAGTGAVTVQPATVGGGDIAPIGLPGSPTIATRPALENLGKGGPFPVIDPGTGKLNKALQDQLMTAFIEVLMGMNDNPFLEETAERAAFIDGATKGVEFLKDAVAVDPTKVTALKGELATALEDGVLTDEERTSLAEKLNEAGMADAAKAVEDGSATDEEIATLQEQVDGAASAKLEKDITAAMEDGKLTAEERASIEGRLGKEGLDALEQGVADGEVTEDELKAIAEGTRADETARTKDAASEGPDAAKSGAADATDGEKPNTTPAAGGTDAAAGAESVQAETAPSGDAKSAGDGDANPAGDGDAKPGGDGDAKPAGGSDKPGAGATPQSAGDAPAGESRGEQAGGKTNDAPPAAGDASTDSKPAAEPAAA